MASASTPSTDGTEWAVDLTGEKAEELSSENPDDPPEGGEGTNYTYIRIKGISPDELDDEDKTVAEKRIIDFLLRSGYPISQVDVLPENVTILEYDNQ